GTPPGSLRAHVLQRSLSMSQSPVVIDPASELRRDWELLLVDVARIRAWERLLVIDCGDGWIVEEAWRRALKGYACGVDTSAVRIARAAALRGVPGKLEFKTWDGTQLPCADRSFHCVLSTGVWERSDPASLLSEIHRVLQPGGEAYVLEFQPATALAEALHNAGAQESHELIRRDAAVPGAGETCVIL